MKVFSLLLLVFVGACNQGGSSFHPINNGTQTVPTLTPVTTPTPKQDPAPRPDPIKNSNSHDLVVEIDQVNHRFTVTGNAGQVCGETFRVIDRLNYEVLTADTARITMSTGKIFELTRVDSSNEEEIWGDWETEITEGDYQGEMIFHIRLNPVMNVEGKCEAIP